MTQRSALDAYWKPSFDTLYEAYYQELASEALVRRWQSIETVTGILVALTASGSALAGWPLWNIGWGKWLWTAIAGLAALAAIAHREMAVSTRVKEQEELRRLFSSVRFHLETFRQDLVIGLDAARAKNRYDELTKRLSEAISQTKPDIGFTAGLRLRVQESLNKTLTEKGYLT